MARRQINVPLIKNAVMGVLGCIFGVIAGISGIGLQVASVTLLTYMLGLHRVRARGTSMAATFVTSLGALVVITGSHMPPSLSPLSIVTFIVGCWFGTLVTFSLSKSPVLVKAMRTAPALELLIGMFMLADAFHAPSTQLIPFYHLFSNAGAFAIGAIGSAATTLLGMVSSVLIIPLLIYAGGLNYRASVTLMLLMIAVSSILPCVAHSKKGNVASGAGTTYIVGCLLGGAVGGLIIAKAGLKLPGILFGFIVIVLGAWRSYLVSQSSTEKS
ncbi:MAG: sulfite exporter TauE/SafE family protein [Armatimonadetes bacterium]|nr:sulfite exporter TauE/SafE family protein [Armatimonadota bacterium]